MSTRSRTNLVARAFQRTGVPLALALGLVAAPHAVAAQAAKGKELPLKYAGPATKAEITAGDLMTRLYIYADDSLMGRSFGTDYNVRATNYIEREARRMGLVPAGDSGGYFQYLPAVRRALDPASTVTVEGASFRAGVDFIAGSGGKPRQFTGMARSAMRVANLDHRIVVDKPKPDPKGRCVQ